MGLSHRDDSWKWSVTYTHAYTHTQHSLGLLWTRDRPSQRGYSSKWSLCDASHIHTTICRTPLGGGSASRREFTLANNNLWLTHTHHSIGLLRTRDRLVTDLTNYSQQTDIHASCRIRTRNLSKRAAADPRLRPRGRWDPRSFLTDKSILRGRSVKDTQRDCS